MADAENFKYGGSLPILFYGVAFPIAHLIIYLVCYLSKQAYLTFKHK